MRYLFVLLFTKKSSEGVLLDKQKLKPETVEKLSRKNTNSKGRIISENNFNMQNKLLMYLFSPMLALL